MSKHEVYRNPRPAITIKRGGGQELGNCYYAMYYEVTSSGERLTREQLRALFDAGFIGYGQEFGIESRCDGEEEPAGVDVVPCTVEIDGVPTDEVAWDTVNHKPYEPANEPYYVYNTYARVDSSD